MSARLLVFLPAAALLAGCVAGSRETPDDRLPPDVLAAQAAINRVGEVAEVRSGEHADWVLLNAGYDDQLRPGMKITVRRQGKAIASLVVAETTAHTAAALILELQANQTVRSGDSAHITTN